MLNLLHINFRINNLKDKKFLSANHVLVLVVAGPMILVILFFLLVWQPTKQQINAMEKEKTHWEQVFNSSKSVQPDNIPGMSQLPDLFERCKQVFNEQKIIVSGLNVERFVADESDSNSAEDGLGYALVHLNLSGPWEGIEQGLTELQQQETMAIGIDEVTLDTGKAECLLKVYYRKDL